MEGEQKLLLYFYINLNPSLADTREMLRDPKGLTLTTLFTASFVNLFLTYTADSGSPFLMFLLNSIWQIAVTAVLGVFAFNELGLAHLRRDAIEKGFNRPQLPYHRTVFDRMLAGNGIYLTIAWLLALLYLFSPAGPGLQEAFHATTALLLIPIVAYAITYSNERYQIWYGEIWPNDDDGDGGGWDDVFIPDPTPHDQLSL